MTTHIFTNCTDVSRKYAKTIDILSIRVAEHTSNSDSQAGGRRRVETRRHNIELYMFLSPLLLTLLQYMYWLLFVSYLSGEISRCLLSSPHRSLEYCLFWAPLILPILWREQSAQGSPFPPNIIIWSGLICTAMYWYMQERGTQLRLAYIGWMWINHNCSLPSVWFLTYLNVKLYCSFSIYSILS